MIRSWPVGVTAFVLAAVLLLPPAFVDPPRGDSSDMAVGGSGPSLGSGLVVPGGAVSTAAGPHSSVDLSFTLAFRNPTGLSRLLEGLSNPASASYRHFLSSASFDQSYAPSPTSVSAVQQYLWQGGATSVEVTPDGLGVVASVPATAVPSLLGTSVRVVPAEGGPFYALASAPTLPSTIAPLVAALGGLGPVRPIGTGSGGPGSNPATAPETGVGQFVVDGATGAKWYVGSDFVQAYGESVLFPGGGFPNASFPTGEAVATILMSGYNQSLGVDLPPFDPRAVDQYYNDTFPPTWPHPRVIGEPVDVNGVTPPLPGPISGPPDVTFNQVENSLDLEMAGSTAPGATLVNFYFAASQFASGSPGANLASADMFASALSSALAFNYSPERLTAVTNSYGLPDLNDSLWNSELEKAQAMGVTVLAASGDAANAPSDLTGRFQGQWPTWPASAAFAQYGDIAVGGTTLDVSGNSTGTYVPPNLPVAFDPSVSGIGSEVVWYNTLGGSGHYSGTEGGVSVYYPEPAWQFVSAAQWPIVNATVLQGVNALHRTEPDVSLAANATVLYVSEDGMGTVNFTVVQGTSISSPLFAGLVAEWTSVSGHPFGYLDPELYRIGSFFQVHGSAGSPFHDVLTGRNYFFSAGPGWDPTTGWGTIDAGAFLLADANQTIAEYVYTGPTPTLPPAGSPTPPYLLSTGLLLALGVGLTIAAVVVLVVGRPRRPPAPPAPPGGAYLPTVPSPGEGGAGPAGGAPPATFPCPYCGAERPAEPVRCPACGTL